MGEMKPYLAVFLSQAIFAGMVLLSKAAFNGGMNTCVFIFYRQLAGTVFLVLLVIIFERKNATPLSFVTFCKIFMLAFVGITLALNAYAVGLHYTSATLGAATINALPITTFILAVLFRMENVKIRTIPGIAKVAGIIVCMAGVATLALYKGPHLNPLVHHRHFNVHNNEDHQAHVSSGKTWMKGCFFLLVSAISWGFWIVYQAQVIESYPSKLMFTSLQSLSSAVQSFVVAIAFERDLHQWKLGWNVNVLAVAYCGIVVTGLTNYLQAWVIEKRGPVFPAVSTPLCLIITIIGSMLLLGETTNLGSVLGGILLVISLYSVLWGKSKERNVKSLQVQADMECAEVKEAEVTSSEPPFSA